MATHKLSLRSALFINLNIILGTGIFINSAQLARHMGPWGALSYAAVGIVLLPLILAMATLVTIHKGGSFYEYAAPIHPFVGFISQWSYFVGKLAACALGIHVFVSLMQTIFIPLKNCAPLWLDMAVVGIFCLLNMFNLRINSSIQIGFFVLKMIPIMLIIIAGIIYFSPESLINTAIDLEQLFVTIPFALYAFTGFEATCSLIHTLENPATDGPKALLYSYGLSVVIAIAFQTFIYLLVGPELQLADSFSHTFPLVFKRLFADHLIQQYGIIVIHTAIACSALGAAYGVMFSNAWNLYTLAEKKLLGDSTYARRVLALSRSGVPYICIMVEALIIGMYLLTTQGAHVPLQQTNTLALTITFSLSVLGLVWYQIKQGKKLGGALLACASCLVLVFFLSKNFIHYQSLPSMVFIICLLYGIAWYFVSTLTHFKQH